MPSTRGKIIASLASVAVIAGAGSYGTFSAFTESTSVAGNTYSAGTLDISKGATGTSIFALTNLRPGDTAVQRCVTVTNTGSLSFASLKLWATVSGGLATYLDWTVERGTGAAGGASADCTGFTGGSAIFSLAKLSTFPTSNATAINDTSGWASNASKSYRFTAQLPSSVTEAAAEGASASVTLNWDATS